MSKVPQVSAAPSEYQFNECISNNNGLNIALTTSETSSLLNIDSGCQNGYNSFLPFNKTVACPAASYLWSKEDVWPLSKLKWYQNADTGGPVTSKALINTCMWSTNVKLVLTT